MAEVEVVRGPSEGSQCHVGPRAQWQPHQRGGNSELHSELQARRVRRAELVGTLDTRGAGGRSVSGHGCLFCESLWSNLVSCCWGSQASCFEPCSGGACTREGVNWKLYLSFLSEKNQRARRGGSVPAEITSACLTS